MSRNQRPAVTSIVTALSLAAYLVFAPILALLAESWMPIWFGACLLVASQLIGGAVLMTIDRRKPEQRPSLLVDHEKLAAYVRDQNSRRGLIHEEDDRA